MTEPYLDPVFHILHDLPEDNDAFGPHEKIADTLATMIAGPAQPPATDADHAGYFVALEGGWGSGKSTVIKMLRGKLDSNSQVIIFDAWAHSGDHLRRAFLEVLIGELIEAKLLKDPEAWKKKLEKLSGRMKVGRETRSPTFTGIGKIFGLSLLLMPIGGVLASSALGKLTWPWHMSDFTCLIWSSLALTVSPLVVLFVTWLIAVVRNDPKQKSNVTSMLFNRWDDNLTIETESDPDPTSIEFQRLFQGAVSEALSDRSHRLVLVVDNLDRLPPSDAMHLWRTLQTFIDKNEHAPNTWAGKLWTLVPYDRRVLSKHFNEIRISTDADAMPFIKDNNGDGLGHFEKIFDTSLHVPKPAPTLWQKFFKDLLAQAFPNEGPEDLDKTIRLMEATGGLDYTPRALKRIINAAGPIYIQWRCEFSLADIVYYVLEKRTPAVTQKTEPTIAAVLGRYYRFTMDAIKYNAPIEIARQGQLISSIQNALPQFEHRNLERLEEQSGAFGELLTWACQGNLPYWNVGQIAHCATNLMSTEIFHRLAPEYAAKLRNIFTTHIEQNSIAFNIADLNRSTFLQGLMDIHLICNHLPSSHKIMTAVILAPGELRHVRPEEVTPIANAIRDVALAIHETWPLLFDDELINMINNHIAIQRGFSPEEINDLTARLTAHRT